MNKRLCRSSSKFFALMDARYAANNGVQMTVMADYPSEKTTDVPEHAYVCFAWVQSRL